MTDLATTFLPIGEKPSVEANVAIGKTNTQDKSMLSLKGEDKRQVADNISNTAHTTAKEITHNNISPFVLLLLVLGWLLPTPRGMWEALTETFGRK